MPLSNSIRDTTLGIGAGSSRWRGIFPPGAPPLTNLAHMDILIEWNRRCRRVFAQFSIGVSRPDRSRPHKFRESISPRALLPNVQGRSSSLPNGDLSPLFHNPDRFCSGPPLNENAG